MGQAGSQRAARIAVGADRGLPQLFLIQSAVLDRFVGFENADVLFLYSTLVLNNSETLK